VGDPAQGPPLHIGVDARELLGQPTGVGRFLAEVLRVWAGNPAVAHRFTLFLTAAPPAWVQDLGSQFATVVDPGHGAGTWWEQTRLAALAHRAGVDVLLCPGYTAPVRLRRPLVVVVYDVSFFAHPEWFSRREGLRRRWLTRIAAQRASGVVTISEFSAREIRRWLGVARDRLHIAPPAGPRAREDLDRPRPPTILFVGSLFNRRHVPEMLAAFEQVLARVPDARLVLVGDNRTVPRQDPTALAQRLGIAGQVEWQAYVTDEALDRLYDTARIFLFLSDYEGFAMTPLEALAHGAPPALLDTPVAREVYGNAARYVSLDPAEIARALTELLTDDEARERLVKEGRRLLERYTWADTGARVLRVLEQAAARSPASDSEPTRAARGSGAPASERVGGSAGAKPPGSGSSPALDVIVVNRNTRDDLLACLESLHAHPPARPCRVLVVDNASEDGSAQAVRDRFSDVDVIALDRNVGFGAANNLGIRASGSPLVLLLNSDTVVGAGAIDALIERLDATGAEAAGPRLVTAAGSPEVSFGPMLSPFAELVQRARVRAAAGSHPIARRYIARLVSRERVVDWVSGACLLVRRDAALAAGLFDERYFLYEEDVDFCAALRARGGRILFTPRAEIVHLRGRSRRAAGATADVHYDRSHLAFYEKHAPAWAPILRWWMRVRGRGT
jgi:hypothetical protein